MIVLRNVALAGMPSPTEIANRRPYAVLPTPALRFSAVFSSTGFDATSFAAAISTMRCRKPALRRSIVAPPMMDRLDIHVEVPRVHGAAYCACVPQSTALGSPAHSGRAPPGSAGAGAEAARERQRAPPGGDGPVREYPPAALQSLPRARFTHFRCTRSRAEPYSTVSPRCARVATMIPRQ